MHSRTPTRPCQPCLQVVRKPGRKTLEAAVEAEAAPEPDPTESYGLLRRAAVALQTNPDFELLVILLIFANCATLAMFRPLEAHDSPWNARLETAGAGSGCGMLCSRLLHLLYEPAACQQRQCTLWAYCTLQRPHSNCCT